MAEATFTIRAVDATRQAFNSVQASLSRIGQTTRELANVTKLAFGASAMAKSLDVIDRKLTAIGEKGEDLGFSDEQIASAIQMERAIQGISNFLMRIPILLAQVGIQIKDNLVTPTESVDDAIRRFRENLNKTRIEGLRKDIAGMEVDLQRVALPAGEIADSLLEDAAALRAQAESLAGKDTVGRLEAEKAALQKIIEARRMNLELDQRLADAQRDYADASSKTSAAQRVGLSFEETKKKAFLLERTIGETSEAIARLKMEGKPTGFLSEDYIRRVKEYSGLMKEIARLEQERSRLAVEAGDLMAQGFEDAIFSGEKLSEVLRNLAVDLMRLVFRNLVTAPLAGGITDIIKGVFGMRADGGPVAAKRPYVVGERGPEIFLPQTSGAIVPNSRMRAAANSDPSREFSSPIMGGAMTSMVGAFQSISDSISALVGRIDLGRSIADPISRALSMGQMRDSGSLLRDEFANVGMVDRSDLSAIAANNQAASKAAPVGTTVNVNYTIQSGVSRAELTPILENERKRLRAEIPDMVRRGGSYRAAFA